MILTLFRDPQIHFVNNILLLLKLIDSFAIKQQVKSLSISRSWEGAQEGRSNLQSKKVLQNLQ